MKILLVVYLVLFGVTPLWGESFKAPESPSFPSLISSVRIHAPLDFCQEPVPLDRYEVRERLEKELLLTLWDRPQVVLWIKRSNRYIHHIEKMLKQNNMPDDLKYVAIAESALRPHAGSRKGAIGFWQFMQGTGRKYGLIVNKEIDQRRNIFASTMAAIRYFKELYAKFGSWTLSAAAYNMGEDGLESEILAQNTDKYYHLYLPLETQRYIFRLISAKLILSDPEKYGFRFNKEDLYPSLKFDRVQLECFQTTPIVIVAQAAKTTFKVIKDFNPEIRGHHISIGSHSILIPEGRAKGFHARYQKLLSKWTDENQRRVYVVKEGDSLYSIAERFNLPLRALAIWNQISLSTHIHPGDELIIYPNRAKTN
ncbi:MAG: transglycosylase SLT domain-containing protein [Desulfobacterales bacterium]|nr:MAG: transglycosylase SLT domain-containing protein [Desulfobacterales bacterium]